MRTIFILLTLCICSLSTYTQVEGQYFCDKISGNSYFPLDKDGKKYFWGNTYYSEHLLEPKTINGKEYIGFHHVWEKGQEDIRYLREEKGVIYEFEKCCENETIRYDPSFKKGYTWKNADGSVQYTVISKNAKLKTPLCSYKKLYVLRAEFENATYFYYFTLGYGFIGATNSKKELISFITPSFNLYD